MKLKTVLIILSSRMHRNSNYLRFQINQRLLYIYIYFQNKYFENKSKMLFVKDFNSLYNFLNASFNYPRNKFNTRVACSRSFR